MAASQSQLSRHILDHPLEKTEGCGDTEREELRSALVSAQESLAVQILLEACLQTIGDEVLYHIFYNSFVYIRR